MTWKQILKQNFTDVQKLAEYLELTEDQRVKLWNRPKFVLNLPRRLAAKIEKGTLDDPILRQFVPLADEQMETAGFVLDPVCDGTFRKEKKVLHKYAKRALLVATSACAMHCRFCFRQNFPYETSPETESAIAYFRENTDLDEVIFSGGDPLSLPDHTLGHYLSAFNEMSHLKRIRFHTRFPIGIPERIDSSFLALLGNCQKQVYFILHCNHPRELDAEVVHALKQVAKLGIPVLNQCVLLKGVNDDEATQLALSEALVNAGILPYYLHALDPVRGTAHFHVSDERGLELIKHVQQTMSGYGVPRFVREESGKSSKTYLT
jgi:EF-P beta-lysylation protein EpmB